MIAAKSLKLYAPILFGVVISIIFTGCSYNGLPDPTGAKYVEQIREYRQQKNRQFRDSATTPFSRADLQEFQKLRYFNIKKDYVVWAQFKRIEPGKPFIMPTTGSKNPYYIKYGKLRFTLKGTAEQLTVYRKVGTVEDGNSRNYLFVPFMDETNGEATYSAGRYLDLHLPIYNGQLVKLDFNKAYNPFCVYNYDKYDCPIPPEANHLDIPVRAGEKMYPDQKESKTVKVGSGKNKES